MEPEQGWLGNGEEVQKEDGHNKGTWIKSRMKRKRSNKRREAKSDESGRRNGCFTYCYRIENMCILLLIVRGKNGREKDYPLDFRALKMDYLRLFLGRTDLDKRIWTLETYCVI